MFEAYLGGASLAEVSKHFHEYSQAAIYYTAYHYNWPSIRDEITIDLQNRLKQKVLYSKYQQLELVSTMIQVAHVENMQAMQAYLKNPTDRNLPKGMRVKSIKELQAAIDMMAVIIGQDNMKKIDVTGNITSTSAIPDAVAAPVVAGALTESTAKALLKGLNRKVLGTEETTVDAEVVRNG